MKKKKIEKMFKKALIAIDEKNLEIKKLKKEIVDAPTNFSELKEPMKSIFSQIAKNLDVNPNVFSFFKPHIDPKKEKLAKEVNIKNGFVKEVVGSSTTFSSRFMPNVKFKIADTEYRPSHIFDIILAINQFKVHKSIYYSYETDKNGAIWNGHENIELFNAINKKEVSIYEAMPELVPDGMLYNKESDSLVKLDPEAFEAMLAKTAHRNIKHSQEPSIAEKLTIPLSEILSIAYKVDEIILDDVRFVFKPDSMNNRKTLHTVTFASIKKS